VRSGSGEPQRTVSPPKGGLEQPPATRMLGRWRGRCPISLVTQAGSAGNHPRPVLPMIRNHRQKGTRHEVIPNERYCGQEIATKAQRRSAIADKARWGSGLPMTIMDVVSLAVTQRRRSEPRARHPARREGELADPRQQTAVCRERSMRGRGLAGGGQAPAWHGPLRKRCGQHPIPARQRRGLRSL